MSNESYWTYLLTTQSDTIPAYAISGMPPVSSPEAPMYTEDDLNGIRESSQFARYILDFATAQLAPGTEVDGSDYQHMYGT